MAMLIPLAALILTAVGITLLIIRNNKGRDKKKI